MSSSTSNLGHKVSTRDLNWLQLVQRAWGAEFTAPDHGIYEFSNGRRWDSTDRGLTGLYGVEVDAPLEVDDPRGSDRYTDMDRSALVDGNNNPIHTDGLPYEQSYDPHTAVPGYAVPGMAYPSEALWIAL